MKTTEATALSSRAITLALLSSPLELDKKTNGEREGEIRVGVSRSPVRFLCFDILSAKKTAQTLT